LTLELLGRGGVSRSELGFDGFVGQIGSGVDEGLLDVFIGEIRVFGKEFFPIFVEGDYFENTPDGESGAFYAWLPVQNFWIYCDSVKFHG
jgi:hypothetical protein